MPLRPVIKNLYESCVELLRQKLQFKTKSIIKAYFFLIVVIGG